MCVIKKQARALLIPLNSLYTGVLWVCVCVLLGGGGGWGFVYAIVSIS